MIDPMIAHYDISAPSLLVKEAGGVWSDFGGVDQLTTESIATTPSLQQAILEAFA
jgi:fructose-1,6-bisphosphatase/inositol monophosphatase family enzyme